MTELKLVMGIIVMVMGAVIFHDTPLIAAIQIVLGGGLVFVALRRMKKEEDGK